MTVKSDVRYRRLLRLQLDKEVKQPIPSLRQKPIMQNITTKPKSVTKAECKAFASYNYESHVDECGELNCTGLAETIAHEFDRSDWLDDSDHWVWEIPLWIEGKYLDS